jgi:hypothetical protein
MSNQDETRANASYIVADEEFSRQLRLLRRTRRFLLEQGKSVAVPVSAAGASPLSL